MIGIRFRLIIGLPEHLASRRLHKMNATAD